MNIEDLKETAALAHLNLEEAELAAAFPAFEEMLGYFAAMQAAGSGASPLSAGPGSGGAVNSARFRADGEDPRSAPLRGEAMGERLLENSGERDGRFVVVPNVL
jgi:aspartyl-tRNA(Asn)/glutamyl-tRNA(Gln) amidotransferase subunit C